MAETLTKSQAEVGNVLFDVVEQHRTFDHNYGNALADIRRRITNEVAIAAATGLVLGGLVGTIIGLRRR